MKKIYLVGDIENNEDGIKWRNEIKKYFYKYSSKFKCISSTDYYEYNSKDYKTKHEIMRFNLRKVKESDIILVNLKDIRKSIETSDEIFYAYILGKPIIGFLENVIDEADYLLDTYVHPWKYEQIDRIENGKDSMIKTCDYIRNYYG